MLLLNGFNAQKKTFFLIKDDFLCKNLRIKANFKLTLVRKQQQFGVWGLEFGVATAVESCLTVSKSLIGKVALKERQTPNTKRQTATVLRLVARELH
jgi:hypothetical protein